MLERSLNKHNNNSNKKLMGKYEATITTESSLDKSGRKNVANLTAMVLRTCVKNGTKTVY